MTSPRIRVSIIGGGEWGHALAQAAHKAGSDVALYSRKPPEKPSAYAQTSSLAEAARHAALLVLAVPSHAMAGVARELGDHLDGRHVVVHGVRGLGFDPTALDDKSVPPRPALRTMSDVLRDETPVRRLGALGGPVLTSELAQGEPSIMVVGSQYPEVIDVVKRAFGTAALRIYATDDLVGLEWASALTGALAVSVGFARGIGLGAGIVAAFTTRGVHEAARIAAAAGAKEQTFLGLGGFGDVLAALADPSRPEARFGEALAKGNTTREALDAIGQRIEAVDSVGHVAQFAARRGVEAPIFTAVAAGLASRKPADELVRLLMTRPVTAPA